MADERGPVPEMLSWLAGDEARAAAAAELHRRGLPGALVDDLIGATAIAVAGATVDGLERPIAYARRALASKAVDLLRGTIRTRLRETPWPDDTDVADGGASPPSLAGAQDLEDALRRALHALVSPNRPWIAAAGLTTLTLAAHPDVAIPRGAPAPNPAAPGQADRWAALWLAGERECFPATAGADDASMRQRRSRALRAIDGVLADAAAAVGLGTVASGRVTGASDG